MVANERLIKFPVPDWNRVISSDLDSIAYCLCYQYDFGPNNFGPYGFNTDKSSKIIHDLFPNLFFYRKNAESDTSRLISTGTINSKGIYLYGDTEKINLLQIELDKYYLSKKKNEMRLKKNLNPEPLPSEPVLLGLEKKSEYRSDSIRAVINSGCGLFIHHHYIPEAGDSIILFDCYLESSIKNTVLNYDVDFLEVDSIDTLKAW